MLPPVLQVITGAGLALATWAVAAITVRFVPRSARRSAEAVGLVAVATGAVAVAVGGSPTGGAVTDGVVNLAAVVLLALGMSLLDRLVALPLAVVALLGFGASPFAAAAVGLGVAIVTSRYRVPALKAVVGGLVGLAVVTHAWDGPNLLAAAALLICAVAVWAGANGRMSSRGRRRLRLGTLVAAGLGVAAVGSFALSLALSRTELERSADLAVAGLAQVRAGDDTGAQVSLAGSARGFRAADRRLSAWWTRGVDVVPVVAQNARATRAMARAGNRVSSQASLAAQAGDPGALKVTGARVPLDTAERLLTALAGVVSELESADTALARSSSPWLLGQVEDARRRLGAGVDEALPPATQALQVLQVVPGLFGETEQRRYFLALQTPSEQRASGGVMGTYGLLSAEGGALHLDTVGSDTDLNVVGVRPVQRRLIAPPDYTRRYGGYHPERFWQNVTMSPDFPTVARVIQGLYPQSGGPEVDGVIAMDPTGLAHLLSVVGPIEVPSWPVPLTSQNVEQALLYDEYVVFADRREARHDFLESVVRATYERLAASTLPGPRRLADVFAPVVRSRHLMLFSERPDEQAAFTRIRADSALAPVRGDYLSVVTQNSSGNKIDWFFRRSVRYDVRFDPRDRTVLGKITVTLRNTAPDHGVVDDIIGSVGTAPTPRGYNRMLVSVYTPLEATATSVDGVPVNVERDRELGRNVISVFVTVPPLSERVFVIDVQGRIAARHPDYRLDVGPQPMVADEDLTLSFTAPPGWIVTAPRGWVRATRTGAFLRRPLTEPLASILRLTPPD